MPTVATGTNARRELIEGFACSTVLALMFAPPIVESSRHRSSEVCQSDASLTDVIPARWSVDAVPAADLFAAAEPHTKRLVVMLYGGRSPRIARGWMATQDTLESVTLISPRPDPVNHRLLPGTLLIRVITNR